jgi:type IV pilus assembly protein PilA
MNSRFFRPATRRRGLTLMELIIVMAILIALAAIIVPILPGLLGRAERSSRATNSQEIYKTLQTYEAMYTHFPTDFDSLTDGTAACTYVGGTTGATPALAIATLTATQSAALSAVGINRLQLMATDPSTVAGADDTFSPYQNQTDRTAAVIPITASTTPTVVTLTALGQFQLNLLDSATATPVGTFVVFGLGKRCSIIGVGMNEAPVNYFDSAALSPNTRYERYGVVFQVSGLPQTGSATQIDFLHAKLVRVFRFGGTLGTGDDAIRDYWKDVAQGDGA